jgi:diguanylate cyclase (GGDEF)-like protein
LRYAATDELTGAWVRKAGLAAVARELERAHRTGADLVLAFVDVDRLKHVNDSQGHTAGDGLLRSIGDALRAHVRTYDVLVRYGGDEIVCAMPNLTVAQARERFETISARLLSEESGHSITFGLVQAEPDDTVETLIGRADQALLASRRSRRPRTS